MNKVLCSIVIPVLNEAEYLDSILRQLKTLQPQTEILFVDGGSNDCTIKLIESSGFDCIRSKKGRAIQMNTGASKTTAEFILFLHADVKWNFDLKAILQNLQSQEIQLANFSLRFDSQHWFLNLNSKFSQFTNSCFQFGDQGLWISRELFCSLNGFNEDFMILEDNELMRRAKKQTELFKCKESLIVSARKYYKHGVFKLQLYYFYLYFLYRIGWPIKQLNQSKINDR